MYFIRFGWIHCIINICLQLTAKVFKKGTREETDLPLDIHVNVDDVNDNAPQFQGSLQFTVAEHSSAGETNRAATFRAVFW